MSRFEKVWLPADRALDRKVSQTMLKHANFCLRSGYLYAKYKGEAQNPAMARGSAFHEVLERALLLSVEMGEPPPVEVVKAIVEEVLAEVHVPVEEHDFIREMAWRWANDFSMDPAEIVAVERLVILEIAGWQVRMKIDVAGLSEDGARCWIRDWKTARGAPGYEEISRVRPDDTRAAKNLQLVLYALGMAEGLPVTLDPCSPCAGLGVLSDEERCPACRGRGVLERVEPFPLAAQAQEFDLAFVFPGVPMSDGSMMDRPCSLTRLELSEYRQSIAALVGHVERAEQTGDWPALESDDACSECPALRECPIPSSLRDYSGRINTLEEAEETAQRHAVVKNQQAATMREMKAWSKAHGNQPVRLGLDKVLDWSPTSKTEIRDRDGMFEAVDRAVTLGVPFEREQFVKVREGTSFGVRNLTVDELSPEGESNDGS